MSKVDYEEAKGRILELVRERGKLSIQQAMGIVGIGRTLANNIFIQLSEIFDDIKLEKRGREKYLVLIKDFDGEFEDDVVFKEDLYQFSNVKFYIESEDNELCSVSFVEKIYEGHSNTIYGIYIRGRLKYVVKVGKDSELYPIAEKKAKFGDYRFFLENFRCLRVI